MILNIKESSLFNKIFCIIPAYNAESTIERTIESALNQKEVNLSVIIVDHGSTDYTKNIVEKISRDYQSVTLISLQRNKNDLRSPTVPLNYAYNYLNSKNLINEFTWFMRLDSDDFLSEKNIIYNTLYGRENYKLLCAKLTFFDTSLNQAFTYGPKKKYRTKQGMLSKGAYAGAHHAMLIRGDLLKRLPTFPKLYDETLTYGDDLDLTLYIFKSICEGEYLFVEESILFKSLHEQSISELTSKSQIFKDVKYIFNKHKTLSKILLIILWSDLSLRRKNSFIRFLRKVFGYPAHKVGERINVDWKKFLYEQKHSGDCF